MEFGSLTPKLCDSHTRGADSTQPWLVWPFWDSKAPDPHQLLLTNPGLQSQPKPKLRSNLNIQAVMNNTNF